MAGSMIHKKKHEQAGLRLRADVKSKPEYLTSRTGADFWLEWATLHEVALDVALIGGGVRVELPAHLYESVADLVSREIECCGNWLELSLARKFDRLDLTLISKTEAGVTDIRSLVGLRTD